MTKQTEALKMAMYELEIVGLKDGDTYNACKEALAEAEKQNVIPSHLEQHMKE